MRGTIRLQQHTKGLRIFAALILILCALFTTTAATAADMQKSYIKGMPPANAIFSKIKGKNGFDTLARQSAAALILRKAAETLTDGRYLQNQLSKAEGSQLLTYRNAESKSTGKGYAYSMDSCWSDISEAGLKKAVDLAGASSPPAKLNCGHLFFRLTSYYEFNSPFQKEVRSTLIEAPTLATLKRLEAKQEAERAAYRARQEEEQKRAEAAFNRKPSAKSSKKQSLPEQGMALLEQYKYEVAAYFIIVILLTVAMVLLRKLRLDSLNPMRLRFGRGIYHAQILTGEVVHSDLHTSVSSYTTSRTAMVDGQAVTLETPHVTSTTYQKFFLKMNDGSEEHFKFREGDFSVRPGHFVSELALFKEGEEGGLRMLLFNHNTGEIYSWDHNFNKLIAGPTWPATLLSLPGLMLPYIPFSFVRAIVLSLRKKALMRFIRQWYMPQMLQNQEAMAA